MISTSGTLGRYCTSLLGEFTIYTPNGQVITPRHKKARACLVLLLAEPNNMQRRREWVASKLWPDVSSSKAYASLRQTISVIRRSFGEEHQFLLGSDKLSLWLTKKYINTDTSQIDPKPDTAKYLIDSYLEGFDFISDSFHEWKITEKAKFQECLKEKFERKIMQYQKNFIDDFAKKTISLKINHPKITCQWEAAPLLADFIADLTSQLISDSYDIDILDYRNNFLARENFFTDLELSVSIMGDQKNISVSMNVLASKLHTVIANELITASTKELSYLKAPIVSHLISQTVKKINSTYSLSP